MTTKANRRGSVEVQQLALWKHQQNLEEIKMLKANNSIQIATPLTKSESSPFSPEAQSKLSKLVSRKNKGTSDPPKAGAQANSLHTNISHVMNSVRDHLPAPPQHHPDSPPSTQQQHRTLFTTAAEHPSAKIASNTIAATDVASRGDLEALLKEKQQWLRTIHEDNGKMAKMLKELQEAKISLARKMDEVDTDRKSLLQNSSAAVTAEVEGFLKDDSDLSERKRDLALPPTHQESGAELLRELLMIAGQFRLNQGETREFFYKTVRQTVNNFVSAALAEDEERGIAEAEVGATEDDGAAGNSGNRKGRDAGASRAQAELSHQLEVLRALAATGPGNIRAAEGVAASVASALIRAAGERTMDLMQLHQIAVDRRQQQALKEELIATQKENAELRASLAQLRKSNVQLRMKAAATMMLPSARGRTGVGGGASVVSGGGGVPEGKEGGSVFADSQGWGTQSVGAPSLLDDGHGLAEHDRPMSPSQAQELLLATAGTTGGTGSGNMLQSSERLPKCVEKFLLSELAAHAQQVIEGHPLASTLTSAMIGNLSKELSREVQGIAAAAFFAYMHHRLGLSELPEPLLNGTITSILSAADAFAQLSIADQKVCEQVRQAVEHVLQVSTVHTEVSALVTLYLTYLHCRPKTQAADSHEAQGQQRILAGIAAGRAGSRSAATVDDDADSVEGVLLMEGAPASTTNAAAPAPAPVPQQQSSLSPRTRARPQLSPASPTAATPVIASVSVVAGVNGGAGGAAPNSSRTSLVGAAMAASAIAKLRKHPSAVSSAPGGTGAGEIYANPELGTSLLDSNNRVAPSSPGASLPRYMQSKSKR